VPDCNAFGTQPLRLLGEHRRTGRKRDLSGGTQNAVPGKVRLVGFRKNTRDQTGAAGITRHGRDLAIGTDRAVWHGVYGFDDFLLNDFFTHHGVAYPKKEMLMKDFAQIADWVSQHYTVTLLEPFLLGLELSIEHGKRHQGVFLSELIDDDGRKVLRISTVVADAEHSSMHLEKALAFNWQSRSGYLALGQMDGRTYLNLCENRPYEGLSLTELERVLLAIGGMGDAIERQLQSGDAY
jgi:hypothetical protein